MKQKDITEGPPMVYVLVLYAMQAYPLLPGVAGYRREDNGDMRPICKLTGNRIGPGTLNHKEKRDYARIVS